MGKSNERNEEEAMERLTKKQENKYWLNCSYDEQDAIQQLGKLEDLQDELGVPLEVLFKALKDGIYRFYEEFEDEPPSIYYLDPIIMYDEWRECWIFYDDSKCQVYCLKDYGVTWALTREEEEND